MISALSILGALIILLAVLTIFFLVVVFDVAKCQRALALINIKASEKQDRHINGRKQ